MARLSPLCAIVDSSAAATAGWPVRDLASAFLDGGARFLQIRAKQMASGAFLELCDAIVELAASAHATVIVNDRVDVAQLSGAAGVHLGQEDLPPSVARTQLGEGAVIGYSTHTIEQIEKALREPVTYTAVGPVFGTGTKSTGYEPVGLALVTAASTMSGDRPIVAIGGITLERAPAVIAAGAASVAIIGDLLTGGSPDARVRAFVRALS